MKSEIKNLTRTKKLKTFFVLMAFITTLSAFAQPVALDESLSIRKVMDVESWACTRIDIDPATQELYYATVNGDIKKVNIDDGSAQTVYSSADHGLEEVYGFDIGTSGNIYLVSMDPDAGQNVATVKKYDGNSWTTMVTATYPKSSRDHRFNTVVETPDQQHILVNSGARTDHGELKSNDQRENAFTAKLLKFPVSAQNVVLQDDPGFMQSNGYIYAAGLRNTYDVEYNAEGLLFGCDQADQSDRQEELNWIRKGHHYGFPWRIGDHENLMRYPDYDPPESDPLVTDVNMESTFHNDPDFPEPPDSIPFTHPVVNHGPDQDLFRDTTDAEIKDASDIGRTLATYTPHSAPLALTFDTAGALGGEFNGKAFSMSYSNTHDRKFVPFDQIGEDLLMIDLDKTDNNYEAHVYRIAKGFNHPVDATLIGNKMYVIEHTEGAALWEVTFPDSSEVPVSIPDLSRDDNIAVYPNPFTDQARIHIEPKKYGQGAVSIYTLQGSLITYLWKGICEPGQSVDLVWDGHSDHGNTGAGIYLVRFTLDGRSYYSKVIKRD